MSTKHLHHHFVTVFPIFFTCGFVSSTFSLCFLVLMWAIKEVTFSCLFNRAMGGTWVLLSHSDSKGTLFFPFLCLGDFFNQSMRLYPLLTLISWHHMNVVTFNYFRASFAWFYMDEGCSLCWAHAMRDFDDNKHKWNKSKCNIYLSVLSCLLYTSPSPRD